MSYSYNYTRNLVNGRWDIDNKDRVDGASKQIHLANEVETALPGKDFHLECHDNSAKFDFVDELTGAEQTTLNGVVSDHQNNT